MVVSLHPAPFLNFVVSFIFLYNNFMHVPMPLSSYCCVVASPFEEFALNYESSVLNRESLVIMELVLVDKSVYDKFSWCKIFQGLLLKPIWPEEH
jgi:hypothetical protein